MNRREFLQISIPTITYAILPKHIKTKEQNIIVGLPICIGHNPKQNTIHLPMIQNTKIIGDTISCP